MNDEQWKNTAGAERSKKISATMKGMKPSKERNKKVSQAMTGLICITVDGKRRRVRKDDSILRREDIVIGWK